MSRKKFYISPANYAPKLPVMATAFWWMFLDYTQMPDYWFGIVGTLLFAVWTFAIYKMITQNPKDIFSEKDD